MNTTATEMFTTHRNTRSPWVRSSRSVRAQVLEPNQYRLRASAHQFTSPTVQTLLILISHPRTLSRSVIEIEEIALALSLWSPKKTWCTPPYTPPDAKGTRGAAPRQHSWSSYLSFKSSASSLHSKLNLNKFELNASISSDPLILRPACTK